jgi:heme oxygenase (biliverdin-IX-beta and delta-forming)
MSQHANPQMNESDTPEPPEPTYAERARTLMHIAPVATLCTTSQKHPDWPFGSIVTFGLDDKGNPSFLISTMAMHTKNILADPRASVFVMQPGGEHDPLGAARLTVMGKVTKVPKSQDVAIRAQYLARHPQAGYWADFGDFSFYLMDTIDVYYVGGFGSMGWVTAEEYAAAKIDPLADAGPGIIDHLNTDHKDALLMLARASEHPEADEATLTAIDRLGFHLRLKIKDRYTGLRLAFPQALKSPEDARPVFVNMVKQVRETSR